MQRDGEETRGALARQYAATAAEWGIQFDWSMALAGAAVGAIFGYLSGYSSYANSKPDDYAEELSTYRAWAARRATARSVYERGDIIDVLGGDRDLVHGMVQHGTVMYTYDVGRRLRVAGHHDPIKHALLAEGKDVYAAGTAHLDDPERLRLGDAIKDVGDLALLRSGLEGMKADSPQVVLQVREIEDLERDLRDRLGFPVDTELATLQAAYDRHVIAQQDATLGVTEDSGHYSPSYDSGHMAVEAWRRAGYRRIRWEPRHRARGYFDLAVREVDDT